MSHESGLTPHEKVLIPHERGLIPHESGFLSHEKKTPCNEGNSTRIFKFYYIFIYKKMISLNPKVLTRN